MTEFRKVLIANRGEIVVRIARTLREMKIPSVAVASDPDRSAPHARVCDEVIEIGGVEPPESYLDVKKILKAANDRGADAIHPGYGFLSQNAEFAEACAKAGVTFIGPKPETLRRLGRKVESRQTAEKAGVPSVPGSGPLKNVQEATTQARTLGIPLMLKATAGGGGKGIRRIERLEDLPEAFEASQREALGAFGDGQLYFEKLLTPVRHVEVQIIADAHGTVVALGERDCTLQRRFQKIIEESPSPAVDTLLRGKLQDAARRVASAAGYLNAGTVEFLLQPDGTFFFMEMNTRLQVEHPVTEAVMGVDLVRLQIEVASGGRLTLGNPAPRGHAIEARIYAEDPDTGFLPAAGQILKWTAPSQVRTDHALVDGLEITPYYDPMLAKVIAWAPDRETARRQLLQALRETVLQGITTNLSYLCGLLETPEFRSGDLSVDRLPKVVNSPVQTSHGTAGPWESLGGWRIGSSVADRTVRRDQARPAAMRASLDAEIRSPMTGRVVKVLSKKGDTVKRGQILAVITAMKMEFRIEAPRDGVIDSVACREGEQVDLGKILVLLSKS